MQGFLSITGGFYSQSMRFQLYAGRPYGKNGTGRMKISAVSAMTVGSGITTHGTVSLSANCFRAFLDILFLPCIVLVSLSGWRTSILWDHACGRLSSPSRRNSRSPLKKIEVDSWPRPSAFSGRLTLRLSLLVLTATLWRAADWSACSKILKRSKRRSLIKARSELRLA